MAQFTERVKLRLHAPHCCESERICTLTLTIYISGVRIRIDDQEEHGEYELDVDNDDNIKSVRGWVEIHDIEYKDVAGFGNDVYAEKEW